MKVERALELLGLGPNPTSAEVEAAWRQKRSAAHPDKGGDPDRFSELSLAHIVAANWAANRPCAACSGSGKATSPARGGFVPLEFPCPACGGSGRSA